MASPDVNIRYNQRAPTLMAREIRNPDLVINIHKGLALPGDLRENETAVVRGDYEYCHYGCDQFDDRGWGCGYRTLQTMCSWAREQVFRQGLMADPPPVPSLRLIQDALVAMGDKQDHFRGSREWIGSVEVAMCMDYFYNVTCKIIHVSQGRDLCLHIDELRQHFNSKGGPVMMGGDKDAASKGILGVSGYSESAHLLVLDPHYYGPRPTQEQLAAERYLSWKPLSSFMDSSFYNLCLPQLVAR